MEVFYNLYINQKSLLKLSQINEDKLNLVINKLKENNYNTLYFKESLLLLELQKIKNLYRYYKINWNKILLKKFKETDNKESYYEWKSKQLLFNTIDIGGFYKIEPIMSYILDDMLKFIESDYEYSSDFIYFMFVNFLKNQSY